SCVCDASKCSPMVGNATFATARGRLAMAATRISVPSTAPARAGPPSEIPVSRATVRTLTREPTTPGQLRRTVRARPPGVEPGPAERARPPPRGRRVLPAPRLPRVRRARGSHLDHAPRPRGGTRLARRPRVRPAHRPRQPGPGAELHRGGDARRAV